VFDPSSPSLVVELLGVTSSAPGQSPTIRFRVELDGQPLDIATAPLTRLGATFAGPNTDFARYWQATIQGAGATGTLTPVDAAAGVFDYTTAGAAAIPGDATGSYTVAFEAYLQAPGGPRHAAESPVLAFAVTDPSAQPRRRIVDSARCDACHYDLAGHGGGRKGADYCVLCHNPNNPNEERAARFESADILVESVDFKVMIHKIHAGEELDQAYFLGGFPAPNAANPAGTPIDFGETRYPRARSACEACHDGPTYTLPLAAGVLPSALELRTCLEDPAADGNAFCEAPNWVVSEPIAIPPETAACTGCHDAPSVAAHAEVMTTATGEESCATCHGPGSSMDVAIVHSP
jgi:OmcA/MtrC family decaheme c-type cytochrome